MANVLEINKLEKEAIKKLVNSAGEFTGKSSLSLAAEKIGKSSYSTENIICVGLSDGGESFNIDKLIDARSAGISIVFFHDNPRPFLKRERRSDEKVADYETAIEKEKSEYVKKLENFGISDIKENSNYVFFEKIKLLNSKHEIFKSPFDLSSLADVSVEKTHTVGIVLSNKCSILAENPNVASGAENFYLALYEEDGFGKVVHLACGHNKYNEKNDFNDLSSDENKIVVNILSWLSK